MNYEKIDMGSYQLHFIKTKKFKTITVEINFRREVKKEEITARNLLKAVLLNSSRDYKCERELIKETENLYDLKLLSSNSRIGNYSNLSFKIRFLNEKYTEEGMNEYSISFLTDLLFHPNIDEGHFCEMEFKKCKSRLSKSIKGLVDNKLKYSLFQLLETVSGMPYSYNAYGYLEDLEKIDSTNLYEYYRSVLADDYVDVFVVGDVDVNQIKGLFHQYFRINTYKKVRNNILVNELAPRKRIKKVTLEEEANQSQLTVLCTLNGLTDFERRYVALVYGEILGGSSNSLLFDTVREKNSYAYYINANPKVYDNILLIYSGIENGNSEAVLKLIRKTLVNMSKGNFDDKLVESAKETLISSIKASLDSPAGIINTYYAKELVHSDDFMERIKNMGLVSKNDIVLFSKKVNVHTMFLLVGKDIGGDIDEED